MAWIKLTSQQELDLLIKNSEIAPKIIFKHSTRCSLSASALNRLNEATKNIDIYIIDIINYRDISNMIAQTLQVRHQSPQLLVVNNGICSFQTSHMDISASILYDHLPENQI
jgi:bacillithiol system protein YtxJ